MFLEAAALRDYWNDLGNPIKYTESTHSKRKIIVKSILDIMNIDNSIVEEVDFFWTSKQYNKLWSPGRWSESSIDSAGLQKDEQERLIKVKWAFNAKPDVLIISNSTVLVIEAKVESGEGRNGGSGYRQLEIQELISSLIKRLVPKYEHSTFHNILLAVHPPKNYQGAFIGWKDLLPMILESKIDDFTKNCMIKLDKGWH